MRPSTAPTNRLSLVSFLAACLTVLSFCIGVAPIPLSAWVCYPAAMLLGLVALISGFTALRQIRTSGEKGRASALVGIGLGGLTILGVLCFTTLTVLFLTYGIDYLHSLWLQPQP
jgi:hypothetical protein